MRTNIIRTLAACAIAGVLAVGASASAMAASYDSSTDDGTMLGCKVASVVSGSLDEASLALGKAVSADAYLANLGDGVEWAFCGASTYGIGDGLMGSGCSDGSTVTEDSMGVAHKTLPLGTQIQIVYEDMVVNATVCDRGPFIAGRDIDLQPAVAGALGFSGVGSLRYRVIG